MILLEIKQKLAYGDIVSISKITGLSYIYCSQILDGSRASKSRNAKNVITAAKALIRKRDQLQKQLKTV